jgi:hypothetical protein
MAMAMVVLVLVVGMALGAGTDRPRHARVATGQSDQPRSVSRGGRAMGHSRLPAAGSAPCAVQKGAWLLIT